MGRLRGPARRGCREEVRSRPGVAEALAAGRIWPGQTWLMELLIARNPDPDSTLRYLTLATAKNQPATKPTVTTPAAVGWAR